jgi:YD repeat-containing protein
MSSNRIEYDNTATGVIFGLPTAKIRTDVITGDIVRETTQYSPRGLPIEKIDPIGNTSTFVYDDRNITIAHELNPLGWKVEYTYDYTTGKPLTTKNQNNITTKVSYDIW